MSSVVDNLHLESTICVTGTVSARPESQIKKVGNRTSRKYSVGIMHNLLIFAEFKHR